MNKHERYVLFGFLKYIGFLGPNFLEKIVRIPICSNSLAVRILGAPRYIIVIVYSVIYTGIFRTGIFLFQ